jgi:hypothetical protein
MTNCSSLLHRSAELRYRVAIGLLIGAVLLLASGYHAAVQEANGHHADALELSQQLEEMRAYATVELIKNDRLQTENDELKATLKGIMGPKVDLRTRNRAINHISDGNREQAGGSDDPKPDFRPRSLYTSTGAEVGFPLSLNGIR